jgi:hypothetical protein
MGQRATRDLDAFLQVSALALVKTLEAIKDTVVPLI